MRVWLFALLISALALTEAGTAAAAGFSWSNHAAPLDFMFVNEIDGHQQTHLGRNGNLSGYLYIHFTGETTTDGYRVATHADCTAARCTVGWLLRGQPGSATFLYQVAGDHPVWLVSRSDIPQPGGYSHFHWLRNADLVQERPPVDGYFLELTAIDFFCFVHMEQGAMVTSNGRTCRDRGGVIVTPGLDLATHTNIVTSVQNGASGM